MTDSLKPSFLDIYISILICYSLIHHEIEGKFSDLDPFYDHSRYITKVL